MEALLQPLGLHQGLQYELGHSASADIAVANEKYSHTCLIEPIKVPNANLHANREKSKYFCFSEVQL